MMLQLVELLRRRKKIACKAVVLRVLPAPSPRCSCCYCCVWYHLAFPGVRLFTSYRMHYALPLLFVHTTELVAN